MTDRTDRPGGLECYLPGCSTLEHHGMFLKRPECPPAAKDSRADWPVQLTERQLEIAMLVADGLSSSDIAGRLKVTTKTVEYHRRGINKTTGMKGTALLVRYLIREGLLEP